MLMRVCGGGGAGGVRGCGSSIHLSKLAERVTEVSLIFKSIAALPATDINNRALVTSLDRNIWVPHISGAWLPGLWRSLTDVSALISHAESLISQQEAAFSTCTGRATAFPALAEVRAGNQSGRSCCLIVTCCSPVLTRSEGSAPAWIGEWLH